MSLILQRAPAAELARSGVALGAALTLFAAQPAEQRLGGSNAAPAAFAVLDHVAAAGGCDGQLDLLLLLAADELTSITTLRAELTRSMLVCPHDPTPGWIVGEAMLHRAANEVDSASGNVLTLLDGSRSIFRALVRTYPDDSAVLTGLGDVYLQTGRILIDAEPFTARQNLASALSAYRRVAEHSDDPDAAVGAARTLIALREPGRAVALVAPLLPAATHPGPLLEVLLAADEGAHDFSSAERVARQLDAAGAAAYPVAAALLPVPGIPARPDFDDATLALSFGVDRLAAFRATLTTDVGGRVGAGLSVRDMSFIPTYRDEPGVTGTVTDCPSWSWRRDALLAGDAAAGASNWPRRFVGVRPGTGHESCMPDGPLRQLVDLQADPHASHPGTTTDGLDDDWQNLLRWAGEWPAARRAARTWRQSLGERSSLASLRLGEIDFLQHRYNWAATEFAIAGRRAELLQERNDLVGQQSLLDRGAAVLAAGRSDEGTRLLRPLDEIGAQRYALLNRRRDRDAVSFAVLSFYACSQLADEERESGDLHAAVDDYAGALEWTRILHGVAGVRLEVVDNNAALAYLGLNDTATATQLEAKALRADPHDPIFLTTAGYIALRANRVDAAVKYNQQALADDPSVYPAANDLGVELAGEGKLGRAIASLRHAIGTNPHYALAWFNLGVVEDARGPQHALAAQGALARAYELDAALQDRQLRTTIDGSVYRTALDLSKPLPPRWSFAGSQRSTPTAAAGLVAVVLVGFGLARASSRDGQALAEQWLERLGAQLDRLRLLRRVRNPAWAVMATVATFVLASWRHLGFGWGTVTYALGIFVLTAVAMRARVEAARQNSIDCVQLSWSPGMVFGIAAGLVGIPWAPLPIVTTTTADRSRDSAATMGPATTEAVAEEMRSAAWLHIAAPLSLATLCALLFAQAAWLHTPLTLSLANAALVMAGSTLLPIGPLDGAKLGKGGAVAAAGVLGAAVLVGVGLV